MAQFRTRPLIVEAESVTPDGSIWIFKDEDGKRDVLSDSDFRRKFEPVDDAAKEMLARASGDVSDVRGRLQKMTQAPERMLAKFER